VRLNTLWSLALTVAAALVEAGCTEGAAKLLPSTVTLLEGTLLSIRTTAVLSTGSQEAGQSFTANLEQPVLLAGREFAAKGAQVEGKIIDSNRGGRVKGVAILTIRLIRLHAVASQFTDISTNTITKSARTTKGKDALEVLIGSGVGAAIGAIAAGGGAGTGVGTHGDSAVIPNATVLNFELRSPATFSER
jgi:hypothetical protein